MPEAISIRPTVPAFVALIWLNVFIASISISVGQVVTAGQTLLLIEAMKTFNQIKAPKAGTVARILIAAGAPVEFGEPLLILE